MLSPEEKKEIDEELATLPYRNAASIGALKAVQKYRGWVDDDGLKDIAEYLEMSIHELDGVAAFYSMIYRHPVGKHVILVCDGPPCWIEGYEGIMRYLEEKLSIKAGQTTDDGKFTLLTMPCIGLCDKAPAMIIDRTQYTQLTADKIDRILEDVARND